MTSPFEYAKSVTHTKESLYTNEHVFDKEYVTFMVNRSLSNSPQTALFADMMDRCQFLDKKLQYDFYMYGIPKQKGYSAWVKKQDKLNEDHLKYISEKLHVSLVRATEIYKLIGPSVIQDEIDKKGGRK